MKAITDPIVAYQGNPVHILAIPNPDELFEAIAHCIELQLVFQVQVIKYEGDGAHLARFKLFIYATVPGAINV